MRVLQLCNKPPLPATDGGGQAMHSVTLGLLHCGVDVKVLTIATDKHPFLPQQMPDAYRLDTHIEAVYVDTRVKGKDALLNLFSSSSYNIDRFRSAAFSEKLRQVLLQETFDIVQLESLYMTPYIDVIRANSQAKIVLRAHNVEAALWQRQAEQEKNPVKRRWFRSLAKKLEDYERITIPLVDAVVPITEEDAAVFRKMIPGKIPVHVLPFTRPPQTTHASQPIEPLSVFHLGSMDWLPNIEAVKWLTQEIWPMVIKSVPDAQLHLAGRSLDKNDPAFAGKQIANHGEVSDAAEFISQFGIMVAPLRSGGGMRIKLIEAMDARKAIVATTIGAEGTGATNGKELLLADNTQAFAEAIVRLLKDEALAKTLGSHAKEFSTKYFDWEGSLKKLVDFYNTLLP